MICSLSHDAMIPGKQDALAGVYGATAIPGLNVSVCKAPVPVCKPHPINAGLLAHVQQILSVGDVAKVGYAVVARVVIDVINDLRLFAMNEVPSKAMRHVFSPGVTNDDVALVIDGASPLAGELPGGDVVEMSGARIIPQRIQGRFRDWASKHMASMPCITRELYHG